MAFKITSNFDDALSLAHLYSLTFLNIISLVSGAAMPMTMLVASTRRPKGFLEPAHGGSSWVSVFAIRRKVVTFTVLTRER